MTGGLIRPGPERIDPDQAPGGIVVQLYGTNDSRLLLERALNNEKTAVLAEGDAVAVAIQLRPGEAICVVTFDGDTGERITPLGQGLFEP